MNENEIHVLLHFLKQQHPKVYYECLDHINDYRSFMNKQYLAWKEIQKFDDNLIIPSSIEPPSLSKLQIEVEDYDGDSLFNSPTAQKVIDQWFETPTKIVQDLQQVYDQMK
jgi:hypothetical protein